MISAVVLAGRSNTGALSQVSDAPCEALVEVAKRPLVAYITEALLGTVGIERVTLVGPREHLEGLEKERLAVVQCGDNIIDNVRLGLAGVPPEGWVLITSCDIPLVTPAILKDFLNACPLDEGDFFYPIVTKESTEGKYPLTRRTYVSLKDGTYTGGNFFLIRAKAVERALALAERMFAARKSPLRMALILGPVFIVRLLLHNLSVADLEAKVSILAGSRGRAVISSHPEIGIDVDKPDDLNLVRSVLS